MAAIDVGIKCNLVEIFSDYYTWVNIANPANLTGKITTIDIYCGNAMTGLKVAIFTHLGSNKLTARDYQLIGNLAAGLHEGIVVDLDVVAGDYIGLKYTGGNAKGVLSGQAGLWYCGLDQTECVNQAFDVFGGDAIYLWGDGAEPAKGASRGFIVG